MNGEKSQRRLQVGTCEEGVNTFKVRMGICEERMITFRVQMELVRNEWKLVENGLVGLLGNRWKLIRNGWSLEQIKDWFRVERLAT